MTTILVPTDFSKNAENAINYAINLAKKQNAKLFLLHAYEVGYATGYVPFEMINDEKEVARKDAESRLETIYMGIKEKGVICDYEVIENAAVDAILEGTKEKKADLIVMGTKGATGFLEAVFGSNTAKVIEKATCPVIAVPGNTNFKPIKHITYATDYKYSDIHALRKAADIAKQFSAQLNILHIANKLQSDNEETELMKKFMDDVSGKINYKDMTFEILEGLNTETALQEYLSKKPVDLLVMSAHHRSFLDKIFGNSISKQIANYTPVPLMVFHYRNKKSVTVF